MLIFLYYLESCYSQVKIKFTGVYCGGWVGTGPVGVIVSTMGSAFELGRLIEHDLKSGTVSYSTTKPGFTAVAKLLDKRGDFQKKI
jgi:hypothetical protein